MHKGVTAISVFSSPEEKEQYVLNLFSRIAGCYDTMNKIMSFNLDTAWRKAAAVKTGVLPGDAVLDCCCGTGALTSQLLPLVGEKGRVVGIDFCKEMLSRARENCPGAHYVEGNVLDMPFPDNSFDASVMGFALRNVRDPIKAFKEMARVVKPGGKVVILDLSRPSLPVFKQLFRLYVNHIIPFLGARKSGFTDPYKYLAHSIFLLPPPGEILDSMAQASLKDTNMQEMTGGAVVLFWGTAT
jgi:demethylmenaquinone methyltransferase/2-methoxy-6-polyprenyl-1,4-benzoquinol methylase